MANTERFLEPDAMAEIPDSRTCLRTPISAATELSGLITTSKIMKTDDAPRI